MALILAGTMALQSLPTASFALTSDELKAQAEVARADLEELGRKVQAAGEDLYETQYQLEETGKQIEETKGEIEQSKQELQEAQGVLSEHVAKNYKAGTSGLLAIVLQSTSYEEFVSNIYYASKVNDSYADAIQDVKEAREALEQEEQSLLQEEQEEQELLAQQTEMMENLEQQEAEQQAYIDNLDEQIAAKVEEERQAELERQRKAAEEAEAAARKAAEEAAAREAEQQRQQAEQQSAEEQTSDDGTDDTSSYEETSSSTSGSLSASQRNTIISAAYSQIGVSYVFGSCDPGSSFDCSGFTMYCYSQAGISLPHSAAAQCSVTTSISYSELQPGDLVFWIGTGGAGTGGNHVAIYLGDGMIIHANYGGVEAVPLYSGVTGYGTI